MLLNATPPPLPPTPLELSSREHHSHDPLAAVILLFPLHPLPLFLSLLHGHCLHVYMYATCRNFFPSDFRARCTPRKYAYSLPTMWCTTLFFILARHSASRYRWYGIYSFFPRRGKSSKKTIRLFDIIASL